MGWGALYSTYGLHMWMQMPAGFCPLQMLSSQAGSHVLVRDKDGHLVPEHAAYRVMLEVLTPVGPLARQSWRARIVLRSDAELLFNRYFTSVAAFLVREWGF